MKLDLEQVKAISRGYFNVTEENGVFEFHRFTPKAEQYYLETSPNDFFKKTVATSGINFDFYTDSTVFEFDFSSGVTCGRRFYYFDTYVDGALVQHNGEACMWINEGRIVIPLPAGKHRLTIWFPCLTTTKITNVTLDDGACFVPAPAYMKMLCFGDSITQGYDAQFPSLAYTNQLARHYNAYMINQAIGGEKFVPGILDEDFAKSFKPDIITVAYGTNDWAGFAPEILEERCEGFFKKLSELYPDSKIFYITPLWRADKDKITKAGKFEDVVAYYAATAEKYGITVLSGYNFTPHYPDFYSDLRLHPNDLGFGEYSRNLITAIETHLNK